MFLHFYRIGRRILDHRRTVFCAEKSWTAGRTDSAWRNLGWTDAGRIQLGENVGRTDTGGKLGGRILRREHLERIIYERIPHGVNAEWTVKMSGHLKKII